MKDASRSVGVASALLSRTGRDKLMADVQADFDSLRTRHAAKHDRPMATYAAARANATPIDWTGYDAPAPVTPGVTVFDDHDIGELRDSSTGSRSSTRGR